MPRHRVVSAVILLVNQQDLFSLQQPGIVVHDILCTRRANRVVPHVKSSVFIPQTRVRFFRWD